MKFKLLLLIAGFIPLSVLAQNAPKFERQLASDGFHKHPPLGPTSDRRHKHPPLGPTSDRIGKPNK